MTLADLTTDFERRSALSYSKSDGSTVVRHWYDVQHITGPLYKDRNSQNEWGDVEYSLFLFFPGVKDGILWQYKMRDPSRYTPERLAEELVRFGMDTPEHYEKYLEDTMAGNYFVGNAMIRFVRQWNPALADRCAQYREDYYRRKEEQETKRQQEHDAEEAKQRTEEESQIQAEKAKYLGWADSMTAMKFGKVKACLEKLVRLDGRVMTKREFVVAVIKKGYYPKVVDGVTSWVKRNGEYVENKPKTEYRLYNGEEFYLVSKTEFDFAMYIEEHKEVIS